LKRIEIGATLAAMKEPLKRWDPAYSIVRLLGGLRAVAAICGKDPSTIYRWTVSRRHGGLAGAIPIGEAKRLLRFAKETGVDLEAEDFFAPARSITVTDDNSLIAGRPRGSRDKHKRKRGGQNGSTEGIQEQIQDAAVRAVARGQ